MPHQSSTVFVMAALALLAASPSNSAGSTTVILDSPESYPALFLDPAPLDGATQQFLDSASMVELREFLQTDEAREGNRPDTFWLGAPQRRWYRVVQHPLLSSVAPGAEFYARKWGSRPAVGAAVMKGKLYRLPSAINQLLHDAGVPFGPRDVAVWTRALTLICAAGADHGAVSVVQPDRPDKTEPANLLVPELKLLEVLLHEDTTLGAGWPWVRVLAVIGDRDTAKLRLKLSGFRRGDTMELGLYPFMYDFWFPSRRGGPGGFLSSPSSCLDVDGIEWGIDQVPNLTYVREWGIGGIERPAMTNALYCVVEQEFVPTALQSLTFRATGLVGETRMLYVSFDEMFYTGEDDSLNRQCADNVLHYNSATGVGTYKWSPSGGASNASSIYLTELYERVRGQRLLLGVQKDGMPNPRSGDPAIVALESQFSTRISSDLAATIHYVRTVFDDDTRANLHSYFDDLTDALRSSWTALCGLGLRGTLEEEQFDRRLDIALVMRHWSNRVKS